MQSKPPPITRRRPRVTDHRLLVTPPRPTWLHPLLLLTCAACIAVLAGCANRQSQMGVENKWRTDPAPVFEIGATTQSEVMKALGPPSQVIALGEQTLFYYLREQQKLEALSLVIYSHSRERIMYDRAIFFFGDDGVLQDFALSEEAIPRREKKSSE